MFDQMIVSCTRKHRRNPWAYFISMTIQILVIGVMILVPLLYTEALPTQAFVSWVAAPPPPPPPPPPPAPKVAPRVVKKVSLMEAGKLRAPSKIPERIAIIREEEMPNMPGVVGGVPGGIASGQDALEFMVAGARAVQVGTATFVKPSAAVRIVDEIRNYCAGKKIERVEQLVGTLQAG